MSPAPSASDSSEATRPVPAETQPTPAAPPVETRAGPSVVRRFGWFPLVLLLVIAAMGVIGYQTGAAQRAAQQRQEVALLAEEQFGLGVQDLEAGRYELARQRFEYVIRLDPTYPGAPERLAEALLALQRPVATPTRAATPTPNRAPVEELFRQAEQALAQEDWTGTIELLLSLRAKDPAYRPVEVDGMMYAALRYRGVARIAREGLLEEGLYDLSRAERFGPLDREAGNWRSWAQLYLLANSYFGVDWAQAAYYFGQVYLVAPYLKNDAYLKYAQSAQRYGDQLEAAGDPCAAVEQYAQSLLAWENATLVPTATEAAVACERATAPPPPPPAATATGTPTETATPTPEE